MRHTCAWRLLKALCLTLCLIGTAHGQTREIYDIDLPAQSVADALNGLSQQTGVPVVFPYDLVRNRTSHSVSGRYTLLEALEILLEDTGLSGGLSKKGVLTISLLKSRAPPTGETSVKQTDISRGPGARLAAFFASFAAAFSASAQQGAGGDAAGDSVQMLQVEEVIVSARRREESQQDVPLSLVAVAGEEIANAHVDDLSELSALVPGLVYSGLSITPLPTIYLRGLGTANGGTGVDPAVGVAIDGVITPRSSSLAGDFTDIERIEVLRGPQGTLFGKNSSGGLVSIVTKDPTADPSGMVEVDVGSYSELKGKASISGPLAGDKLLGRLSAYAGHVGGYWKNLTNNRKIPDDDQRGARATLVYQPVDATRLRLSLYGTDRRNNWSHSLRPVRSIGPLSSASDQLLRDIAGPENVFIRTSGDGDISYYSKTLGATLQADQQLGDFALTSITGYQTYYWRQDWFRIGATPAPFPQNIQNAAWNGTDQWSQELRIASPTDGRIDYVGGLYFYKMRFQADLDQLTANSATTRQFNRSTSKTDTLNYAAFGEANLHLTDELTFIAGARWTHEEKDLDLVGLPPPAGTVGFLFSLSPGHTEYEADADNWSWRTGFRWQPLENHSLYATAARGFKGPGFNTLAAAANAVGPVTQIVEPEVTTSYELGAKSSWLDRRLVTNVAVFYTEATNLQVQSLGQTVIPDGSTFTAFVLTNAAKARTQGVELEIGVVPLENLSLNLRGAYTDGIYKDYFGAACYPGQLQFGTGCVGSGSTANQDLSGTRLPIVPKFSGNLDATYRLKPAGLPFDIAFRTDVSYRSSVLWSTSNAPNGTEGGYAQLGATLSVAAKDGRYEVNVYGKNLTDKFHVSGVGFGGGFNTDLQQVAADYQRLWGASFKYNF